MPTTTPTSSLRQRVGLRTVELVEEPALPPAEGLPSGTSFYFRVNGVPIFAKGSNLIPLDVFAPRETAERARWLLSLAAAANMNMVRVWGGGRYLPDWYALGENRETAFPADRLGAVRIVFVALGALPARLPAEAPQEIGHIVEVQLSP